MTCRLRFVAMLFAMYLTACSQQAVPASSNSTSGLPRAYMSVTFQSAGVPNFTAYEYWIVFNTTGDNNRTPSTIPQSNNWAGYTYAIEVARAAGGGGSVTAYHFVRNTNPVIPPLLEPLSTTPTLLRYVPGSSGSSAFTVTFARDIFASQTPVWRFNAFTMQATRRNASGTIDSMGAGGPNDPQYASPPLDVAQSFSQAFYATYSGTQIDPSARIVSLRFINNP
jgi:hypothetical protein